VKYSKELLNQTSIYSLRIIGLEIGVRAPSSKTKSKLIEEILDIESGKLAPCVPSKRGRPLKKRIDGNNEFLKNNFLLTKLKDEKKRKIIKSILMEIEKLLDELL